MLEHLVILCGDRCASSNKQTNKKPLSVSALCYQPAQVCFFFFNSPWIVLIVSLLLSYVQIFSSLQHLEAMHRICQEQRCANTIPFLRKKILKSCSIFYVGKLNYYYFYLSIKSYKNNHINVYIPYIFSTFLYMP